MTIFMAVSVALTVLLVILAKPITALMFTPADAVSGTIDYLTTRFHGSHAEVPAQYQKLFAYIRDHKLKISGFSREITMIDYGLTNDLSKFVTEISVPMACG